MSPFRFVSPLTIHYLLFTFLKGVYGKADCGKAGGGKTDLLNR